MTRRIIAFHNLQKLISENNSDKSQKSLKFRRKNSAKSHITNHQQFILSTYHTIEIKHKAQMIQNPIDKQHNISKETENEQHS